MNKIDDTYRQLQQHLERMPIGYPSTKSGIELKILKQLFTPKDVEIAMMLGALPDNIDKIHRRAKKTGISKNDLEEKLDDMVKRGIIVGGEMYADKKGNKRYSNIHAAIGFFEFQVNRLKPGLYQNMLDYMDEEFHKEFHNPNAPSQVRTIPIEKSITPEHLVSTYDNIMQIVENYEGPFAVMNCICRQGHEMAGESCKLTDIRESCMLFNSSAEYMSDTLELARYITKEESLDILREAQEAGLVLQPQNTQNPEFICTCCGDCCGILTSVKKLPRPADYYTSNFFAEVNPELCAACESCVDRCQLDALSIVDNCSQVDLDRCIGCGNCVAVCENDAIHLKNKENEITPPKDQDALYNKIMIKRRGFWGSLKMLGRMLLGMRV
jgi:Na+-translocating ferredoxin:NAD+ oxidoreductase RNF subunit RnfB